MDQSKMRLHSVSLDKEPGPHGGTIKVEEAMGYHDFGWALNQLRSGEKVYRLGWNGQGQWIELQVPDENSKMTLPYIFISTVSGDLVPWLASQTDMLAEDWELDS